MELGVWLLSSVVGLAFSLGNLWGAVLDWKALRESGYRNGRGLVAKAEIRREAARAYIQSVFVLMGAIGVANGSDPQGSLLTWIFISVSVAVAVNTVLDWQTRRAFWRGRGRIE